MTEREGVDAPVLLPRHVRDAMIAHARREAPRECCGLLAGRGRTVVAAIPAENLDASETRFRVNEREHLQLQRAVRLVSPPLQIVGVYHSHPRGPARPSPRDITEAFYPDWSYIVIGAAMDGRWRLRGFRIRDGCVRPLRVRAGARQLGGFVESGS